MSTSIGASSYAISDQFPSIATASAPATAGPTTVPTAATLPAGTGLPPSYDGSIGFGGMVTNGGPTIANWQGDSSLQSMSFFPGGGPIMDAFQGSTMPAAGGPPTAAPVLNASQPENFMIGGAPAAAAATGATMAQPQSTFPGAAPVTGAQAVPATTISAGGPVPPQPLAAQPVLTQPVAALPAPAQVGQQQLAAPAGGPVSAAAGGCVMIQQPSQQPVQQQPVVVQQPPVMQQPVVVQQVPMQAPVQMPVQSPVQQQPPPSHGCCATACSCAAKPAAPAALAAPAPGCRHTVKKGETLASIAKKYKVTKAALKKANSDVLDDGSTLRRGMVLTIPKRTAATPTTASGSGTSPSSGTSRPESPRQDPSQAQITSYIRWSANQYGGDGGLMVEIARRESSLHTDSVNNWDSNARAGIPSKGLFQFIEPTFNSFAPQARRANPKAWEGLGELNWLDWRQQSLAAVWAVENGKAGHWSTYRSARASAG